MTTSRDKGSTPNQSAPSDSSSNEPAPEVVAPIPGFRAPPPPLTDPPAATTTSTRATDSQPGEDGGPGYGPDGTGERPPTTSTTADGQSSPTSTSPVDLPGLDELARTLVGLASLIVRVVRGRRRHLPDGVWIADEDDQQAIGDPLARIAERHMPAGQGPTGDTVDGLCALVATAGYTMKGLTAEAEADQADKVMPDLGLEQPDEPGPAGHFANYAQPPV
jgi:hypothetical protein